MPTGFGEAKQLGKSTLVGGLKTAIHHGWGAYAAAGLTALFSQWDHHHEKMRIKEQYENEIGAMVGKAPQDVKMHDMELAAKKNAVIGQALKRSTLRRNLSIGVTLAATAVAIFAAPALLGVVGLGGLTGVAGFLATGASSALTFLGAEKVMEKIGEKKLGLDGPELKEVEHKPILQSKLSVADQITYLQQRRARGGKISQQQVMTVFARANPRLDSQITARYGASFDKLSPEAKTAAVAQFGPQYHVAELTESLNNKEMRVQELAFAVFGQSSGAEHFQSPREAAMQRKIDTLTAQLNAQESGQDRRVAFARSDVSGTVLGDSEAMTRTSTPQQQDTTWQRRVNAQRQQQQVGAALA